MKKLLIDANPVVPYYVSGKVNGIGRTTMELIQNLARVQDLPFEVILYSQNMKGIGGRNMQVPFRCSHLYLPNRRKINSFLSHFPIREIMTGYDLMHITHNFEYVHRPEKCIVTIHDALFMKIQEKAFEHDKMRIEVPLLAKRCKHIITCSESSKRDIVETMQINPEKITVIYWGIKHDIFSPSKCNKEKMITHLKKKYPAMPANYFLSVSCNAERKRTHLLVDAYIKLCKQQPMHDLVLVWRNPPKWLAEKISLSRAEGRVHFLTDITDEELALLYNAATAAFTPSSYEGFGLPLLEAMACGTPVVTCRNSSLEEIADDAALYLEEPVEDSIYQIMEKFENGEVEKESFVKKGIERAKKFTWNETTRQTCSIYMQHMELI